MKFRTVIFLLAGWFTSNGTVHGTPPPVPTEAPGSEVLDGLVVRSPDALLPPLTLLAPTVYLSRLREEVDPVRREQTQLRRQMQHRTLTAPSDTHATRSEKEPDALRLRIVSGNTSGNWSPYPDRALDARTLSFPMRRTK